MITSTIILFVAFTLLYLINLKNNGQQNEAVIAGLKLLIKNLPLILGAFLLAGLIEILMPQDFVHNWLSTEAGVKGIFLGTIGGMLLAMGPYAVFPIVGSILASGAGLGTIIATLSGWSMLTLQIMPFETAFLGTKFYLKKLLVSIPLSIISGFIAYAIDLVFF